ncbi:MAG: TolC family protein, partial [Bryobacteraceae bacterium]
MPRNRCLRRVLGGGIPGGERTMKAWVGLVAMAAWAQAPVKLSLKRAVEIAVSPGGSARVELAREARTQAQARVGQARAALLPNVEATLTEQSITRNLEAMGIRPAVLTFPFPTFVGPFGVLDARATATQPVLDASAWKRYRSAQEGRRAAAAEEEAAADVVAAQVARAYVAALRADADIEATSANVTLAEAVVR